MIYKIGIINKKKLKYYLVFSLFLWLAVVILIVWLKVKIITFIFFMISTPTIGLIASFKYSKMKIDLAISSQELRFDNYTIAFKDVYGYYINNEALVLREIEIRDIKNKDYKITSFCGGANGKQFDDFLCHLIEYISLENKSLKKMTFYDFHKTQFRIQKYLMPFDITFLLAVNVVFIYLFFTGKMEFTWKILFADIMFIGLFRFYRKNKPTI